MSRHDKSHEEAAAERWLLAVAMADRVGWLRYITETLAQYTWSWSARIAPLDKPEGWESEYYPTWLPDGFGHVRCFNGETVQIIWYEASDERRLSFTI